MKRDHRGRVLDWHGRLHMNSALLGRLKSAYNDYVGAGGSMLIDGQTPADNDATLVALAGLDDIDAVGLISDLKTLKMEMEANALGDQAGAAYNSKAIMHLNSSNEARSGVTWTK
jgi:hypothetical protein